MYYWDKNDDKNFSWAVIAIKKIRIGVCHMKRNVSSIFWGVLMILAGAALLADRMGWINFSLVSTNTWVYIFAGLSLVFFLSYFVNGLRQWGWLFPALILGAISLTIWMADRGMEGSFLGMPILLSIAFPFYIGFAFDRKAWGLLIPAWVLTVLAFITLAADQVNGELIGAVFLYAVSLPFLVVFLLNRNRRWALIPFWITFILGTITLLSNHVNGDLIGALFMYAVALPFLVVYLTNHTRRWALIPALATAVLGTIPLLSSIVGGDWMGAASHVRLCRPLLLRLLPLAGAVVGAHPGRRICLHRRGGCPGDAGPAKPTGLRGPPERRPVVWVWPDIRRPVADAWHPADRLGPLPGHRPVHCGPAGLLLRRKFQPVLGGCTPGSGDCAGGLQLPAQEARQPPATASSRTAT